MSFPKYGVDVTFSFGVQPRPDAVHVRVLSADQDWSGWANNLKEATRMAKRLMPKVCS